MNEHNLTKTNTHLCISETIFKKSQPFFKDVLEKFVNIYIITNNAPPDVEKIDVKKYRDHAILEAKLESLKNLNQANRKKIVFVKREGKRRILNEDICIAEIEKNFSNRFDVVAVSFEHLTFQEQLDIMNNCILLMGCHGAGFTNSYFMDSNTNLLEIYPESFTTRCFSNICNLKKIRYYFLNGKSLNPPPITLETYQKESSDPRYNNTKFRASIRDTVFTIDVNEVIIKIKEILQYTV